MNEPEKFYEFLSQMKLVKVSQLITNSSWEIYSEWNKNIDTVKDIYKLFRREGFFEYNFDDVYLVSFFLKYSYDYEWMAEKITELGLEFWKKIEQLHKKFENNKLTYKDELNFYKFIKKTGEKKFDILRNRVLNYTTKANSFTAFFFLLVKKPGLTAEQWKKYRAFSNVYSDIVFSNFNYDIYCYD